MLLIANTNHNNKIIGTEELIASLNVATIERDIDADNSILVEFSFHGDSFGLAINTVKGTVTVLGDDVTYFLATYSTEKALLDWATANA